jgi:nucleoside-diphosphate-sugar epimerase
MTAKTILLTGASGVLGPVVAEHLRAHGYTVRTLSRRPLPSMPLHVVSDITDRAGVARAVEGVEAVVHLAAKLHIENPDVSLAGEYERVNVEGTRVITEAARAAGVKRLVYISTVKVYGKQQATPVDETETPAPKTIYAKSKHYGEQVVQGTGLEHVILRLSAVYGRQVRGSWAKLIGAIRRGLFLPIGDGSNLRTLTYEADVAAAIQMALESAPMAGGVYNVAGFEAVTMDAILRSIYGAFGRSLPPIHIPKGLATAGVGAAERAFALVGRRSLLPVETFQQLVESEVYSGARLRTLGFAPKLSFDETWRAAISRTAIGSERGNTG